MFNVEKTTKDCIKWIQDWFYENGNGSACNAVVGISGGLDSAVVAALCIEALGKNRVLGVVMPNGFQESIESAADIILHLDINFYSLDIKTAVDGIIHQLKTWTDVSKQSTINLPPRVRMATLYAFSQSANGRVANTCNLSEDWIGYSTRYGDSVGDFSPLSNLTKTEVREMAKYLQLPDWIINKAPSDDLCGKTDEENFGFTYEVLDRYIRTGEIEDKEIKKKIDRMHEKNLFKLKLMDSFPYESQ